MLPSLWVVDVSDLLILVLWCSAHVNRLANVRVPCVGFDLSYSYPYPPSSYIPPGAREPRKIPLEIMVKGDKQPMWGSTTEEDMRGYAATTLPFQSFGALGMARTEFDDDSASSQFFWLLFDSDLTPAGKNLLDGAYACFGYTVEGADFLKDIKEGDIIVSASVIEGKEHLQ